MSGFFRRLFSRERKPWFPGLNADEHRAIHGDSVTVTKSKLRKYKLEGEVRKVRDGPDEILASGGCIKEAESADALKEAWERDMKIAFPMGADYNVEYHCTVTPVDDEPDEDDGTTTALATAAAVGAVTMFR